LSSSNFVKVCTTDEIPKDGTKIFNKNLIEFVIINKNSKYTALYNKCPHMGGSLGDGKVAGDYITCPLHSWDFNVETGKGPAGYEDSVPNFGYSFRVPIGRISFTFHLARAIMPSISGTTVSCVRANLSLVL